MGTYLDQAMAKHGIPDRTEELKRQREQQIKPSPSSQAGLAALHSYDEAIAPEVEQVRAEIASTPAPVSAFQQALNMVKDTGEWDASKAYRLPASFVKGAALETVEQSFDLNPAMNLPFWTAKQLGVVPSMSEIGDKAIEPKLNQALGLKNTAAEETAADLGSLIPTIIGLGAGGAAAKAPTAVKEAGRLSTAAKSLADFIKGAPKPVKWAGGAGTAATGFETARGAIDPDYADRRDTFPSQFGASLRYGAGATIENLGDIANWQGKDNLGNVLKTAGQSIEKGYEPKRIPLSWDAVLDPDFYANNVASTIPMTASLIPLMYGGWKGGKFMGAKAGLGKFGQTIIASIAGSALSRPVESAMEAGGVYDEAIQKGMTREQANQAAQEVFEKNLALGGLDALQLGLAFVPGGAISGRLARMASSPAGKLGIKAATKTAGLGFEVGSEALEEGAQQAFTQQALGDDERSILQQIFVNPSDEMRESMFIGGLFGGLMGASGEVKDHIEKRVADNLPPEMKTQVAQSIENSMDQGMSEEDATEKALNELAETPEGQAVIKNITEEVTAEIEAETTKHLETPEATQAGLEYIHKKTGEPLTIIDQSKPEYWVAENADGKRMVVSSDEVVAKAPEAIPVPAEAAPVPLQATEQIAPGTEIAPVTQADQVIPPELQTQMQEAIQEQIEEQQPVQVEPQVPQPVTPTKQGLAGLQAAYSPGTIVYGKATGAPYKVLNVVNATTIRVENEQGNRMPMKIADAVLERPGMATVAEPTAAANVEPVAQSVIKPASQEKPVEKAAPVSTKAYNAQAIAENLKKQADSMQKTIDDKMNPAIANQNPTARRSRIAAGIAQEGERLAEIQGKVRAIAQAIETGTLPESLKGISKKTHIETLRRFARQKNRSWGASLNKSWMEELLKATEGLKGISDYRKVIQNKLQRLNSNEYGIPISSAKDIEAVEILMRRAGPKLNSGPRTWIKDGLADFKRLHEMGIDSLKKLDQAVTDFRGITQDDGQPKEKTQEQKIKEMERALIGQKIEGYFPTPKPVVDELIELADIEPGMSALEPSAGKGNIADELKEAGADVDVIEIYQPLREILEAKGYNVVGHNFLAFNDKQYDRIVMNPPFEKGQDIDHVLHAFELLKPGGKVVAIMSEGPFFRSDKKANEFRDWLDENEGTSEKLPDKSFTGKDSERQTGVAARIVVLDKPGEAEQVDAKNMVIGNETTAKTERGTEIKVQYAVIDADSLIASHDTELGINPDYPKELQPRDRTRVASEAQISRMANNLEPDFLGESPRVSDGAPIIGPDSVVESGNGRVIAIKRAYEQGKADKYAAWIKDSAKKFGLDPEVLETIETPVLVRIRQSEVDRATFVKEANEQTVAAMSATEQALSDAGRLTPGLLDLFVPAESGLINHWANRHFITEFINQVVSPTEQGRYATADGSISQEGINRIRNAVFARAYGDVSTIEKLAESTDNNIKNIVSAMLNVAPKLAKLKSAIETGDFYPLDITREIAEAAKKLSQLREEGTTVSQYLSQVSMFGDELSPLAKDLLDVFNRYNKSSKKLTGIFNTYIDAVVAAGDPKQEALWEDNKPPTKEAALQVALDEMEADDSGSQTTLFETRPPGSETTGEKASGAKTGRTNQEGKGNEANKLKAGRKRQDGTFPWPEDFPEVIGQMDIKKLRSFEGYQEGKSGNKEAAEKVVDAALSDGTISLKAIQELAEKYSGAILAPVHAEEADGKNQLPFAYAHVLSVATGLPMTTDIIQSNKVGHTGANALTRFINRATFEGDIVPGADYIIVDDMIVQGGTVTDLRKYIESNGGHVVAVTTLATGRDATTLPISDETLDQIERKFGKDELEQFLKEYNIAGGIESLTESEGRFLNRWDILDALRERILKGGFESRYDGGEIGGYPEDFAEDRDRAEGIDNQRKFGRRNSNVDKDVERGSDNVQAWSTEAIKQKRFSQSEARRHLRTLADEYGGEGAGFTSSSFIYLPEALNTKAFKQVVTEANAVGITVFPYKCKNPKQDLIAGIMTPDRIMFLNVDGQYSPIDTAHHELIHDMARTNPDLFERLKARILSKIPDIKKITDFYRQEFMMVYPEEDALEEFIADLAAQAHSKEGAFFNRRELRKLMGSDYQKAVKMAGDALYEHIVYKPGAPSMPLKQAAGFKTGRFEPGPIFYSQLERTIEGKMPAKAYPAQIMAIVKGGKVKGEEIKWSGIETWLTDATKAQQKLSKEEVLEFIRDNDLEIEEVERSKPSSSPGTDTTQYDQYTLPGGENYRELRFMLPSNPTREQIRPTETASAPYKEEWDKLTQEYRDIPVVHGASEEARQSVIKRNQIEQKLDELHNKMVDATIKEMGGIKSNYRSSHWSEPNVLAHVRFNVRTGPNGERILFIEEIQSDWHQEGRRKGYKQDNLSKQENYSSWGAKRGMTPEETKSTFGTDDNRYQEYVKEQEGIADAERKNAKAVPDAPFKTTWPEFVLKRMLRYAAENGYDRIAWTTGEQQAERYDLSKDINYISYNSGSKYLEAIGKNNRHVLDKDGVLPEHLPDIIGKEAADRLLANKKWDNAAGGSTYSLEGIELKVGGEGMKGFYDKMIPAFLNKYAKKWGAKVESTTIEAEPTGNSTYDYEKTTNGTGKYEIFDAVTGNTLTWVPTEEEAKAYISRLMHGEEYTVPSLPITDAMHRSVMQGQPKFKVKRKKDKPPGPDTSAQITSKIDKGPIKDRIRSVNKDWISQAAGKLYGLLADDIYKFNWFDEAAAKARGIFLNPSERSYMLAMNSRAAAGTAWYIVRNAMVDRSYNKIGPSLKEILAKIPTGEENAVGDYMILNNAVSWMRQGKIVYSDEFGVNDYVKTIAQLQSKLARTSPEETERIDAINQAIDEQMEHIMNELVTPRMQWYEENIPGLKEAADSIVGWLRDFTKAWLVNDNGMLTEEAWNMFQEIHPNYVPFQRQMSEVQKLDQARGIKRGYANQPYQAKKSKGSQKPIIDPIESIIEQVFRYVNASRRNEVMQAVIHQLLWSPEDLEAFAEIDLDSVAPGFQELLEDGGPEEVLDNMDQAFKAPSRLRQHKPGEVTGIWFGKKITVKINDPEFFNSLTALSPAAQNMVIDFFRAVTRIMKSLTTGLSLFFSGRNLPRDLPVSYINSEKHNPFAWGIGILDSAYRCFTGGNFGKDEYYQLYRAMGGGVHSSASATDRNMLKEAKQSVMPGYWSKDKNNAISYVLKSVNAVFSGLEKVTSSVEDIPRYAEFKKVLGDVEEAGYDRKLKAKSAASEVTVNFARRGSLGYTLDAFIPYFNAALQGLNNFTVAFTKKPAQTMAKGLMAITIPTILLYLINHDDDDWKAMSSIAKDNYYLIPMPWNKGKFIKIAKPREWGVIFSDLPERALRALADTDPTAFKDFKQAFLNSFVPAYRPIFAPFYDVKANKDFANRAIVPGYMQNWPDDMQYDESTSVFAKAMGEAFSMSPKQIDYLIKSYTGFIGQMVLPALSEGRGQGLGERVLGPIKQSFVGDPLYSNDVLNEFYRQKDLADGSETRRKVTGEKDADYNNRKRKAFNNANENISKRNKKIREINANKSIPFEEKDRRVKILRQQILDIATRTMNAYK